MHASCAVLYTLTTELNQTNICISEVLIPRYKKPVPFRNRYFFHETVFNAQPKNDKPKNDKPKDDTPKDDTPKDDTPKDDTPKDVKPEESAKGDDFTVKQ